MNKESPVQQSAELAELSQLKATVNTSNDAMRAIRLDAIRRIVAFAKQGKTDLSPGVEHTDVSFFTDPDQYQREYKKLFLETPLVACLSKDLPEPGSFKLFEETGVPIVVMRGADGQVRAFLNICAHRGARLVRQACGKAARHTCRFHGWTYDTTGKAVGIPDEAQFCGELAKNKQLVSVPAEERHGLVFVQATPHSRMDLDAHLGTFSEALAPLDLGQATCVIDETFENPSNWKYTLITYMENYHLPVLHRDSFGDVFAKNLNILDMFGPHHRFIWPHGTIWDWMNKPESEWPVEGLPLTHFLFPNMHMAVGSVTKHGALISIHRLFPTSVGKMVARVTIYAPHGVQGPEHLAEIKAGYELARRAVRDEDFSVTGESYAGFAHLPAGTTFAAGRHEIGVQNFYRNVRTAVGP